jgi:hypothetical protein
MLLFISKKLNPYQEYKSMKNHATIIIKNHFYNAGRVGTPKICAATRAIRYAL